MFSRSRCFMSVSSDGPRGAGCPRSRRAPGVGPWELRAPAALPSPDGGMAADRPGASRSPCSSWGALRQGFRGGPRRLSGLGRRVRRGVDVPDPRPPPSASPGRSARTARSPPSGRPDGALPRPTRCRPLPLLDRLPLLRLPGRVRHHRALDGRRARLPAQYAVLYATGTSRSGTTSRPGTTSASTGAAQARRRGHLVHRLPHALAARVRARLDPPARVSARRSPRRDPHHRPLRALLGVQVYGCVGTSASRRSPPSGGGSWSCSRRRSWSTRPRVPGDSGGTRHRRGRPRAAAPAARGWPRWRS